MMDANVAACLAGWLAVFYCYLPLLSLLDRLQDGLEEPILEQLLTGHRAGRAHLFSRGLRTGNGHEATPERAGGVG